MFPRRAVWYWVSQPHAWDEVVVHMRRDVAEDGVVHPIGVSGQADRTASSLHVRHEPIEELRRELAQVFVVVVES
jgi:hypothetical protein